MVDCIDCGNVIRLVVRPIHYIHNIIMAEYHSSPNGPDLLPPPCKHFSTHFYLPANAWCP